MPGPLFAIYQVETRCWYVLYRSGRAFTFAVGTTPSDHRGILMYNQANGALAFVGLPRGRPRPYILTAHLPILWIGYRGISAVTRFNMRSGRLAS